MSVRSTLRRLFRISLGTLLLLTLLIGSLASLYTRWSPWKIERVISVPNESLRSAVYSPDGKWIAISNARNGVHLLDAATLTPRLLLDDGWRPPTPSDVVPEALFSPDGTRLATRSDGSFAVWDIASGKMIANLNAFNPHADGVWVGVSFIANGYLQVVAGEQLSILNLADATRVQQWTMPGPLQLAKVTPDATLMMVPQGSSVGVWDVRTGAKKFTLQSTELEFLDLSLDSREIIATARITKQPFSIGYSRLKQGWSTATGEKLYEYNTVDLSDPSKSDYLRYSTDDRHYLTSCGDRVFDVSTNESTPLEDGGSNIAAFSPDSQHILTGLDGRINYWTLQRDGTIAQLPELWLAIVFGVLIAFKFIQHLRRTFAKTQDVSKLPVLPT